MIFNKIRRKTIDYVNLYVSAVTHKEDKQYICDNCVIKKSVLCSSGNTDREAFDFN